LSRVNYICKGRRSHLLSIDIAHIKIKRTQNNCIERRLEDVAFLMVNFPCHAMPFNIHA
jgi:hypothetical protein